MKEINCRARLEGIVEDKLYFSYSVFGERFYEGKISVQRNSGIFDSIPIVVSERIVNNIEDIKSGTTASIEGEIRTYNVNKDNKNSLQVFCFVQQIEFFDNTYFKNEIYIDGYICKEPIYRITPLGKEICDLVVAVNRSYKKSSYIPCISWGKNAKYTSGLKVGDRIVGIGRIQSRKYKKVIGEEIVEKEAYEVSLSSISEVEHD